LVLLRGQLLQVLWLLLPLLMLLMQNMARMVPLPMLLPPWWQ
jgi:hypothetical protein